MIFPLAAALISVLIKVINRAAGIPLSATSAITKPIRFSSRIRYRKNLHRLDEQAATAHRYPNQVILVIYQEEMWLVSPWLAVVLFPSSRFLLLLVVISSFLIAIAACWVIPLTISIRFSRICKRWRSLYWVFFFNQHYTKNLTLYG